MTIAIIVHFIASTTLLLFLIGFILLGGGISTHVEEREENERNKRWMQ